ncbi:hypothetical protein LTR66_000555 [Elasticomyces elasticus]|nr:hypothetical protein LTR28_007970 [Elasticomyces elasticus]KAK4986143.1 hypothetical protein LTR50_005515 [Elasticomyces elasticus]KAK5000643.1 hypothetical protein LTR66_000555 [Elasticomyces elasticus]
MSSNRIISSKLLGMAKVGGKEVQLKVATHTALWQRTDAATKVSSEGFKAAVEGGKTLVPERTAEVIMREGLHPSPEDQRDHYTGVCRDANGQYITTLHFYKE